MSEVNKPAIQEWVTALRSGVYTQGQGRLHRIVPTSEGGEHQFCCLGVACDLFKDRLNLSASILEGSDYMGYGELEVSGYLPEEVQRFLGVEFDDPILLSDDGPARLVSYLNDEKGWSFDQIADAIERTYLGKGE